VEPPSDPIQEGSLEREVLFLAFAFTAFSRARALLVFYIKEAI
jgi:hypothetical protein